MGVHKSVRILLACVVGSQHAAGQLGALSPPHLQAIPIRAIAGRAVSAPSGSGSIGGETIRRILTRATGQPPPPSSTSGSRPSASVPRDCSGPTRAVSAKRVGEPGAATFSDSGDGGTCLSSHCLMSQTLLPTLGIPARWLPPSPALSRESGVRRPYVSISHSIAANRGSECSERYGGKCRAHSMKDGSRSSHARRAKAIASSCCPAASAVRARCEAET